jgi:hypothetical protein
MFAAEFLSDGHKVYAAKQIWVWQSFWHDARSSFRSVLPTLKL